MPFADVSEASGVAVSTLQGYFGSREDMLIEPFQHATAVVIGVAGLAMPDILFEVEAIAARPGRAAPTV